MLEVTICSRDGKEIKRYELVGHRPLVIGRGTVCDIQVPLMDVSRQHAVLEPDDDDAWVLRDLESMHGCVIEGERRREIAVREGLEVRLGSARLRFSDLADRIGAELNALLDEVDPNAATAETMADTLPRLSADGDSRLPERVMNAEAVGPRRLFRLRRAS